MPVPKRILLGPAKIVIDWSDGHRSVNDNKALREACPCALCKGESPPIGHSKLIPLVSAAPEGIAATRYSMVGRYAVSFVWSDGHSTGIYPYAYILEGCECETCVANKSAPKVI